MKRKIFVEKIRIFPVKKNPENPEKSGKKK
jgi:hypothetical protein